VKIQQLLAVQETSMVKAQLLDMLVVHIIPLFLNLLLVDGFQVAEVEQVVLHQ
jgi:hypothetical protein